jgi:hypothetical protein
LSNRQKERMLREAHKGNKEAGKGGRKDGRKKGKKEGRMVGQTE